LSIDFSEMPPPVVPAGLRPRFELERWDDGRLRVHRPYAELLRSAGLTTFDKLMDYSEGETVRQVGARTTTRVVLDGPGGPQTLYVKRHRPPPFRDLVFPLLHGSWPIHGARNEWEAILAFHAAGLPTATPAAFGEDGGRSLLMTRAIEPGRSLLDWITEVGRSTKSIRAVMARVADITRRMHAGGLHHQDFYLNHILYDGDDPAGELAVIDLGRVRRRKKLAMRWIVKDLAQLDFSARRLPCRERLRFLRLYLGRRLCARDKTLIRRIAFKSRRIAGHTQKHGL
jgi:heptose I phosphotransferase